MASRNDVSQGLQSGNQQMDASNDAPGADSRLSHQDKEDVGLVEYLRLCKAVAVSVKLMLQYTDIPYFS